MYSQVDTIVGSPALGLGGFIADATSRMQPGQLITASDNWWGTGEFVYGRANGTIRAFAVCSMLPVFDSTLAAYRFDYTEIANTANLDVEVAVSMNAMTAGQWGWFCVTGVIPALSTATVAAATTFGITAAGQVGANSAGKQIVNARTVAPATTTVIKTAVQGTVGSTVLQVGNSDGWFEGVYLSGTGIAGGTFVSSIDPTGRFVVLSAALTAIPTGSITATYNNGTLFYNVVKLNRSFAQGAIT